MASMLSGSACSGKPGDYFRSLRRLMAQPGPVSPAGCFHPIARSTTNPGRGARPLFPHLAQWWNFGDDADD